MRTTMMGRNDEESNPIETRILKGDAIIQAVISFIENAATKPADSPQSSSFVYSITDRHNPKLAQVLLEFVGQLTKEHPNFRARYITDIQKENTVYVSSIMEAGVEIRHIQGNRVSFSVSQHEYVNPYRPSGVANEVVPESITDGELLWSNNPDLVSEMKDLFEHLWESAVPAILRIRQLEKGIDPGETRVLLGTEESTRLLTSLFQGASNEILVIAAPRWFSHRSRGMFEVLSAKAREERGVKVRVLTPSLGDGKQWDAIAGTGLERRYSSRSIDTGVIILDRSKMLLSQYSSDSTDSEELKDELISIIYTTNKQTVEGMASVFEALWQENELRENEERSRKEAELLRDLLSHDIRNRNQTALIMAELLKDELGTTPEILLRFDKLLHAIQSSTELVDNVKSLGRLLQDKNPTLLQVDLVRSIKEAFELATRANPNAVIRHNLTVPSTQGQEEEIVPHVFADHLLTEVFLNLYSNAVRYTPGVQIEIETTIADEVWHEGRTETRPERSCWKVSVVDQGRGMTEEVKKMAFSRYHTGAEGSGLGLSIVYALVVDRYGGKVLIKDRVEDEYAKGTRVELWLPKSG